MLKTGVWTILVQKQVKRAQNKKILNRRSRSLENRIIRQPSIEGVLRFWNIFYRGSFLYDNVSLWYRWRKVVLPRVAKRRLDSKKHAAMTISKRQNLVKVAMCCSLRTWYRWRSFPRGRKDDWIAERRGLITRLVPMASIGGASIKQSCLQYRWQDDSYWFLPRVVEKTRDSSEGAATWEQLFTNPIEGVVKTTDRWSINAPFMKLEMSSNFSNQTFLGNARIMAPKFQSLDISSSLTFDNIYKRLLWYIHFVSIAKI